MNNSINFELYKVFYFIVKNNSISLAANELFITQPAVSQALKQLESKLNCQLFIRNKKGLILTHNGKQLFNYIEQAYNFILTGENILFESQALQRGELRIGAGDTICYHYLSKYLEIFHNNYPKVKINITNRTSQETINLLKSGAVDIGFVSCSKDFDNSILYTPILKIQDCFVCGPKNKEKFVDKINIADIHNYPILMLEKISQSRNFVDGFFLSKGIKLNPEIELGSLDLLVSFAKIDLGISCVIKNFCEKELKNKEIFEIKFFEKIPKRNIYLARLKDLPETKITKTFTEYIYNGKV